RTSIVLPSPGTPSSRTWLLASSPVRVCRTRSRWPTITRPTSASMAVARSAKASGARRSADAVASVTVDAFIRSSGTWSWSLRGSWSGPGRRNGSPGRVERAEVVADVVLDRERHVVAVEARERVLVEVGEDLLVRDRRPVVLALPRLVALLRLAVTACARDV